MGNRTGPSRCVKLDYEDDTTDSERRARRTGLPLAGRAERAHDASHVTASMGGMTSLSCAPTAQTRSPTSSVVRNLRRPVSHIYPYRRLLEDSNFFDFRFCVHAYPLSSGMTDSQTQTKAAGKQPYVLPQFTPKDYSSFFLAGALCAT